jgi:hypothetical protein
MKTKSYSLIAGDLAAVFSMYAAPTFALGNESFGSVDTDAFATSYRQNLAKEAIANNTSNAEKAANIKARSSSDCTQLKTSAAQATQMHVDNNMPPDPTKVIEKTTCYVSVSKTKIPSTGFGFADAIIDSLVNMSDNGCPQNQNSWASISNAAKTGNIQGLSNMSALQNQGFVQQPALQTTGQSSAQAIQDQAIQRQAGGNAGGYIAGSPSGSQQSGQNQSPAQKIWGSVLNAF